MVWEIVRVFPFRLCGQGVAYETRAVARGNPAQKLFRQSESEGFHSANTSCSVLNVEVRVFAGTAPSLFASRVLSTART